MNSHTTELTDLQTALLSDNETRLFMKCIDMLITKSQTMQTYYFAGSA